MDQMDLKDLIISKTIKFFESKSVVITSVVINVILFISLISIEVQFNNALSYSADVIKVISLFFNYFSICFFLWRLPYTGAKQENRWSERNNSKPGHWSKKSEQEDWGNTKYFFRLIKKQSFYRFICKVYNFFCQLIQVKQKVAKILKV